MKMARAVGDAFKRAKIDKDKGDETLFAFITGKRNFNGRGLSMVKNLSEKDGPLFQPGEWYASSKYSGGRDPRGFEDLIQRVENQTEGFLWKSWQQAGE